MQKEGASADYPRTGDDGIGAFCFLLAEGVKKTLVLAWGIDLLTAVL